MYIFYIEWILILVTKKMYIELVSSSLVNGAGGEYEVTHIIACNIT